MILAQKQFSTLSALSTQEFRLRPGDGSSADPSKIVDFSNFPGPPRHFQSRWPFAKACADEFVSLADAPSSAPSILRSLNAIDDAAPGP